jgi:hypothetical protein
MKKIHFTTISLFFILSFTILSTTASVENEIRNEPVAATLVDPMPNPVCPPGGTGWTGWHYYEPGCMKFNYYYEKCQIVYIDQKPWLNCSGGGGYGGDEDDQPSKPGGRE